jgi:hypothetical protein
MVPGLLGTGHQASPESAAVLRLGLMFLGAAQFFRRDRLGLFFSRDRLFLHRIGSLPLLVTAVMKLLVGGLLLHSYSLTQIAQPGHIHCVSTDYVSRSLPYNDGHASAAC